MREFWQEDELDPAGEHRSGGDYPEDEIRQRILAVLSDKKAEAPQAMVITERIRLVQGLLAEAEGVSPDDPEALQRLASSCQRWLEELPALRKQIECSRRLDLHVHAAGFLKLELFIQGAISAGAVVLVNTDHNSVANQPRLRELVKTEGLFIPFDGAELTVLDDDERKFHLKLYTDPSQYEQAEEFIRKWCQVPTPPFASDMLGALEETGIKYWAVIAHPGDARVGIKRHSALELIRHHNVHVETEHTMHSPQQRRFWRSFVAQCNRRGDLEREVYAEGGSDFHSRVEGERLGWGLVTGERIRLNFTYLDKVGEHFAVTHLDRQEAAIEEGDYRAAMGEAVRVARLVPLQEWPYRSLGDILGHLLVAADKKAGTAELQLAALQTASSPRELMPRLAQIRAGERDPELAKEIVKHATQDSAPEVCLAALHALQRLEMAGDRKAVMQLIERPDTLPDIKAAALQVMSRCATLDEIECIWSAVMAQQRQDMAMATTDREARRNIQTGLQDLLAKKAPAAFFEQKLGDNTLQAYEAGTLLRSILVSEVLLGESKTMAAFLAAQARQLAQRFSYLQSLIYDCACRFQGSPEVALKAVYGVDNKQLGNLLRCKSRAFSWPELNEFLARNEALAGRQYYRRKDFIDRFPRVRARQLVQESHGRLAAGQEAEALEILQRALVLDGKVGRELVDWIEDSLIHTHPLLARELIMALPSTNRPEQWLLRARISFHFKDYEDAVEATKQYLSKPAGRDVEARRYRALASFRLGNKGGAERIVRQLLLTQGYDRNNLLVAVEIDPRSDSVPFKRLQALCPHDPDAVRLVTNRLLRDHDFTQAVFLLEPAAAAHPQDRFLQINLAQAREGLGDAEAAWPHWLSAYRLRPRNNFLCLKVTTYLRDDVFLRRQHAQLAADLGVPPPPLSTSEIVLGGNKEKRDRLAQAVLNCAQAQYGRGQWPWAAYACDLIQEENLLSGKTKALYMASLLNIGAQALLVAQQSVGEGDNQKAERAGCLAVAEKMLGIAISVQPDSVHANHYLGSTYMAQGRLAQAIDTHQKAWSLMPKSPLLLGNLINALKKRGDNERGDFDNALRFRDNLRRLGSDVPVEELTELPPLAGDQEFRQQQDGLRQVIGELDVFDRELERRFEDLLR